MHGLLVADDPAAWEALGFAGSEAGDFAVGGVTIRCRGRRGWVLGGESGPDAVDGIATEWEPTPDPAGVAHPNGATAVDHVVVLTDDVDRTVRALQEADGDLRRRAAPPDVPVEMAFVRLGGVIVEVAAGGGPPRIWGLTFTVPDLDALPAEHVGTPRDAVQPGRRIVTARARPGLETAVAFMTPRVRTRPLPGG